MTEESPSQKGRHWLPRCLVLLCIVAAAPQAILRAREPRNSFLDGFRDPQDGYLDASDWLLEKHGFLPVPIVITEPAVGYGGGAALAYLHRPEDPNKGTSASGEASGSPGRPTPPSITGIGGAGTENGTWGAGLGHLHFWDHDRWRYVGALAYAQANLTFYRPDNGRNEFGGLDYSLDALFLNQQLERRIADSNFFLGARYVFADINSEFALGNDAPGIQAREYQSRTAGAGMILGYDSRDNIFTPSRGLRMQAITSLFDEALGGDFHYPRLDFFGCGYWDFHPGFVLGVRLDGRFTDGDVPFYHLPYIQMRGVQAMRYLGKHAVMSELELRWNFHERWSLVVFGGAGKAAGSFSELDDGDTLFSKGVGFRYLMARKLGLHAGMDFAWGPDDFAFYFTVGSAWMR